jgi:VWFA-related protein
MYSRGDQVFTISFAAATTPSPAAPVLGELIPAHQLGGQTALYDALVRASQLLASRTPARRALLLLSDGEDNYSRATLAEAIAALQHAGIVFYSVSVHSPRLEYPGDRVLRQIAEATGGRACILSSYSRAARILAGIEEELRGQYVVGFRPTGQLRAGEFRAVRIVAQPRGLRLRARPGYFVEPAD